MKKKDIKETLKEMVHELKMYQELENKSYEDYKRIYNLQYTIDHIILNYPWLSKDK